MPPQSSSKGGSSKKASGAIAAMRGKDHPRSRTTTPNPVAPPAASLSAAAAAAATTAAAAAAAAAPPPPPPPPPSARLPPIEIVDTDYLEIRVEQFRNLKLEDLIDQPALPSTVIPDSRSIDALIARLQRLQETVDRRNMFFDRGMRLLVQARKNRPPDDDEDVPAKPEGGSSGAGGGGGDDGKGSRGAKADKADKKTKLKKRKADALTAGDGNLGGWLVVLLLLVLVLLFSFSVCLSCGVAEMWRGAEERPTFPSAGCRACLPCCWHTAAASVRMPGPDLLAPRYAMPPPYVIPQTASPSQPC
jgi:hypothetical protein